MDEKNRNVSVTFGKYSNESIGQVKDISSSAWTPISAGSADAAAKSKKTSQPKKQNTNGKNQPKGKNATAAAPRNNKPSGRDKASGLGGFNLISKGNPEEKHEKGTTRSADVNQKGKATASAPPKNKKSDSDRKSPETKKKAPGSQNQSKSPVKNKSESRTPKGRDLRDDRRNQQYSKSADKERQDYRESKNVGYNHDEYCQKKNETKRKKNFLGQIITVGIVLLCSVVVIAAFCYSKGTPIENIVIEGQTVYSDEEIYQAAGIARGRNLFAFSEKKVRHDITTKLPYIKDVVLEREYPDTLVLRLITTQDKYVITGSSGWITLDSDGKVVSLDRDTVEAGMYRIEGFDHQKAREGNTYEPQGDNVRRFELMKEIVTLLDKAGVIDTAVIRLQNVEDVIIEYNGKIAVYLGNCEELDKKIPGASGILDIAIRNKAQGYIDMRYKDYGTFTPGSMTIQ